MNNSKIKKRIISNILLSLTIVCNISVVNANGISDINNHWAKNEIQSFIDKGYINGYPEDNTFKPENPITRAEFVKVVNKVFGYTQTKSINFTDVNSNEWYYEEVKKAAQAGYINGYPEDNTFRPNQPITREEAAKVISTIMKKQDNNLDKLQKYSDANSVSSWAGVYIEGVLESKYMNGYPEDNTFRPKDNIKRGEAVVTLSRTQNQESTIKIMYTTADSLNVRNGPGTKYDSIGKLPKNSKVEVIDIQNDWAKINYNGGVAYVSTSYLSDSNYESMEPRPLPTIPETQKNIDTPQNPGVIDSSQDVNQGNVVLEKTIENGIVKEVAISEGNGVGIGYSIYSSGQWIYKSNGENATINTMPIEGIKINFTTPQENRHIFYRTKIKGKGWQAWVKDGKISGEIGNGNIVEDIQIREVVSDKVESMVKPTIAIDIGHNVERPVRTGAMGLYKEDILTKAVGERIIYKLRQQGYNVVETLPTGRYSQNDELNLRAKIANLNEVDKFISIHFNTFDGSANGTEVYYSSKAGAKEMASKVSQNIADRFGFKNRGSKQQSLAVLNKTNMPAILVEGCFIDNISDMNKFIDKGEQAYDIMADAIIQGAIN